MHTLTAITDRITFVMLVVSIWSGRKKLRGEDLALDGRLPPEDLISLGSKRVCDPEALRVFHRLKKAAERICLQKGTRFMGGFAVEQSAAAAIAEELAAIKHLFDAEITQFRANYDQALDAWIAALPDRHWEAPIRRAIEPADIVGRRFGFRFDLVSITPAPNAGTLGEDIAALGNGVFDEVAQWARELKDSFASKPTLNRRALGTFRRIREKMDCLSFVDSRIQPVVDAIDQWFARVPATGPINGAVLTEGFALALLLSDPERMALFGAGAIEVLAAAADEAMEVTAQSAMAAVEQPAAPDDPFADIVADFDLATTTTSPQTQTETQTPVTPPPAATSDWFF